MEPSQLFDRWFVQPIAKLKELPDGDGAFAALMIALPLYERYIIAKLKLAGTETSDDNQRQEISVDLNLNARERSIFWAIFRVGFMHQAMAQDGKTKWMVNHTFGELPKFKEIDGVNFILLDPWKFADRVLAKYQDNAQLITASKSFPLPSIFSVPNELLQDAEESK